MTVRFTDEEYQFLLDESEKSNLEISEFIRRCAIPRQQYKNKSHNIVLINSLAEMSRSFKSMVQQHQIDPDILKVRLDELGELLRKVPLFVGTK